MEVGKSESTEANKLESIELGMAMAKSDEVALELLEMMKTSAFCKRSQDTFIQIHEEEDMRYWSCSSSLLYIWNANTS